MKDLSEELRKLLSVVNSQPEKINFCLCVFCGGGVGGDENFELRLVPRAEEDILGFFFGGSEIN